MVVRDLTQHAAACPACGAYGNSQHRPTCQPGRRLELGRPRRARRDSRDSAAARANLRIQSAMIRGVAVEEDRATRAR